MWPEKANADVLNYGAAGRILNENILYVQFEVNRKNILHHTWYG